MLTTLALLYNALTKRPTDALVNRLAILAKYLLEYEGRRSGMARPRLSD